MQPTLDSDAGRLALSFDDLDELGAWVEAARRENGFLIELTSELERGRELAVALAAPGGFEDLKRPSLPSALSERSESNGSAGRSLRQSSSASYGSEPRRRFSSQ